MEDDEFLEYTVYVVLSAGEAVFASYDEDDCDQYIGQAEEEDMEYIEDEFDISEEESPRTANFMAGYYGDAGDMEVVSIDNDDFDEDGYCAKYHLSIQELQDLLNNSDDDESDEFDDDEYDE